jgi:hypothetical protein
MTGNSSSTGSEANKASWPWRRSHEKASCIAKDENILSIYHHVAFDMRENGVFTKFKF